MSAADSLRFNSLAVQFGLGLLAVMSGLLLAGLPLMWAVVLLTVVGIIILTLIDPLAGLGAALILGPTKPATDFFIPQLPLDLGQITLIVALGAWLLHAFYRGELRVPHSPLTVPLLAFVGVSALSLMNALSLGDGLTELIKWVQLIIVMWLVVLEGRDRIPFVVGLVLTAVAIQGLVGVWQFGLRGDGPEHFEILGGDFYRAYGSFEQPNPFGGFLAMGLALSTGITLGALEAWASPVLTRVFKGRSFPKREELLNGNLVRLAGLVALCGLLAAALVMSWSRGAWLGFAVAAAAIVAVWPRNRWIGVGLVVVGVVGVGAALQFDLLPAALEARLTGFTQDFSTLDVRGVDINDANYSVLERVAHWQAAWEMARYHPVLGVGIGNYAAVYPAFALLNWPQPLGHAHNIYLNLLAEVGVLGVSVYLILWGTVVLYTLRLTRSPDVWLRGLSIGLLGVWVHLSAHHVLDKLYVANLHLHIGVLFGVTSLLWWIYEQHDNLS